jgi:hypothetical protein
MALEKRLENLITKVSYLNDRNFRTIEALKANIANRVTSITDISFSIVFESNNQIVLSVPETGLRITFHYIINNTDFLKKIKVVYIHIEKNK